MIVISDQAFHDIGMAGLMLLGVGAAIGGIVWLAGWLDRR